MVTSLIGSVATQLRRIAVDVVNETVLESFLSGEPVVPVGIFENLFKGVARVLGVELRQLTLCLLYTSDAADE